MARKLSQAEVDQAAAVRALFEFEEATSRAVRARLTVETIERAFRVSLAVAREDVR